MLNPNDGNSNNMDGNGDENDETPLAVRPVGQSCDCFGIGVLPEVWQELEYEYNQLKELRDCGALFDDVGE